MTTGPWSSYLGGSREQGGAVPPPALALLAPPFLPSFPPDASLPTPPWELLRPRAVGSLEYLIAFHLGEAGRAAREKENRKGWGGRGEWRTKGLCQARGQTRPGWRWSSSESESEAQPQFMAEGWEGGGLLEANPPQVPGRVSGKQHPPGAGRRQFLAWPGHVAGAGEKEVSRGGGGGKGRKVEMRRSQGRRSWEALWPSTPWSPSRSCTPM